jgi:hypothetical protein
MTNPVAPTVDLVVLSRDGGSLHPEVEAGLLNQPGVQPVLHRVIGQAQPDDSCRYETIARGRNEGKLRGVAPWIMFVDDDVVLEPGCVRALIDELIRRPAFAALAADYLGEQRAREIASHVSMGATLFRREALNKICFTWRQDRCECGCCCDDLRRLHWGLDYYPLARARHIAIHEASTATCRRPQNNTATGHILAAFNRRHRKHFEQRFLHSLRASGNDELVIPVAIGLYPSERRRLASLFGVRPVFQHENGHEVPRRRLRDFAEITDTLPADTPVAYWDAGDVIFQASLKPLWDLTREHPDKILAVREPRGYPDNAAVASWTNSITDPASRRAVQQTIFHQPFLNSGFVAGTARALNQYFTSVANWYDIPKLAGSHDWGDQLALNVYCHSNPDKWHEISESWDYCLCLRDRQSVYRDENGTYVDVRGVPIYAVHGNAHTLNAVPIRRAPHRTYRGSLVHAN